MLLFNRIVFYSIFQFSMTLENLKLRKVQKLRKKILTKFLELLYCYYATDL